jgi:uroporphyrinogen-III synthase
MEMEIDPFMREWSPKLRKMLKVSRMQQDMQLRLVLENDVSSKSDVAPPKPPKSSVASIASAGTNPTTRLKRIALTREAGANDKLAQLLSSQGRQGPAQWECVEIPCIAFGPGNDTAQLPASLSACDSVVLTSPQAAGVFLDAWLAAGRPDVRLATVGKGTSKPLIAAGLQPAFEPSDSTAETLAAELPVALGPRILYPSSAIAENTLVKGLEARGFSVTRLSSYDTVPAQWDDRQLSLARSCDIATFASPSTVRVWAERVGTEQQAVVIGPTSAKACRSAGWEEEKIKCPEGSKGLEEWANLVRRIATEGTEAL